MEITLTLPDHIGKQIQKLPNPNGFISNLIKEALQRKPLASSEQSHNEIPQVDEMKDFKVMEWLRQVREEHYERLKDKTHEEQIAIHREGARRCQERVKREKGI